MTEQTLRDALKTISKLDYENTRLKNLLLRTSGFVAVHADKWARERGFPEGHLHPKHYDLLKEMGARMDDFTRAAQGGENG